MTRPPFNPSLIKVPDEKTPAARGLLTVSQLTALVKDALEHSLPSTVHVVGEISNYKRHAGGHLYLTLKDRGSELSCVMWRSTAAKLKFDPSDGMEVVATGRVEVFERAGRYQLYIRRIEPRGLGALELAFRQLCDRLRTEGLFDERHKRPLPSFPRRIVLVTSPTGAAVADMIRTLTRRFPCIDILVYPVRVQGPDAKHEIAAAIRKINAASEALGVVDVLIVGRGGGSLEDLWTFNEEIVARAIHESHIPVVSAVGHEVDVTVADLVADLRAATPTAAAELVVPVLDDVLDDLSDQALRLRRALRSQLDVLTERFGGLLMRPALRDPLVFVHRREQVLDEVTGRMYRALIDRVQTRRRVLDTLEPVVQRIAPHALMRRRAVELRDAGHRLRWAAAQRLARAERGVSAWAQQLERASPARLTGRLTDGVDRTAGALAAAMRRRLALLVSRVLQQEEVLSAMSYRSVLNRGYSITRTKKGRRVVRSSGDVRDGQRVVTELGDGEFESQVINLNQLELFE